MKSFYITTAIDYVNALPHLGTAYEKIGADAVARYYRLCGYDTFFMMGVDEHSVNVEREAKSKGLDVLQYCDGMAQKFEEVWRSLNISYNKFIRTTDTKHRQVVQNFFQKIYDNGDIYKGFYEGFYCVSCENFILEKDLVDGLCSTHKIKPEFLKEENYFFKLSKYQKPLLDFYESHRDFIQPEIRFNEIYNVVQSGLQDVSITRSNAKWGIPVPFDSRYIVYVWFDALINYVSGIDYMFKESQSFEKFWPADVHVIGKDITRFHCVIWPAMLMSMKLPLPKKVFGHGFVYLKGEKMSKTRGTVVSPLDAAKERGVDALRYYLLREVAFDRDGDFTWEDFYQRYDADLANDLGNLFQRVLSMIDRYSKGKIGAIHYLLPVDQDFQSTFEKSFEKFHVCMKALALSPALSAVWECIQRSNRYVDETMPWSLNKDSNKKDELEKVLALLVEGLGVIAVMLAPFMPETAQKMWMEKSQSEFDSQPEDK